MARLGNIVLIPDSWYECDLRCVKLLFTRLMHIVKL